MSEEYPANMIMISVNYGYDIHRIEVALAMWNRILSGDSVNIEGQGFHVEGDLEQDFWEINQSEPGSLYISTDTARDIYSGNLNDDEVNIEDDKNKQVISTQEDAVTYLSLTRNPESRSREVYEPSGVNLDELPNPLGLDNTIEFLLKYRVPVSLESWLGHNYPGETYESLPAEIRTQIPKILLDPRLNELEPYEDYYEQILAEISHNPLLSVEKARTWIENFA